MKLAALSPFGFRKNAPLHLIQMHSHSMTASEWPTVNNTWWPSFCYLYPLSLSTSLLYFEIQSGTDGQRSINVERKATPPPSFPSSLSLSLHFPNPRAPNLKMLCDFCVALVESKHEHCFCFCFFSEILLFTERTQRGVLIKPLSTLRLKSFTIEFNTYARTLMK